MIGRALGRAWRRRRPPSEAPPFAEIDDAVAVAACPEWDAEWYLEENEDVRRAGIDPLEHYVAFGQYEGRRPGPGFDPGTRSRFTRLAELGRARSLPHQSRERARVRRRLLSEDPDAAPAGDRRLRDRGRTAIVIVPGSPAETDLSVRSVVAAGAVPFIAGGRRGLRDVRGRGQLPGAEPVPSGGRLQNWLASLDRVVLVQAGHAVSPETLADESSQEGVGVVQAARCLEATGVVRHAGVGFDGEPTSDEAWAAGEPLDSPWALVSRQVAHVPCGLISIALPDVRASAVSSLVQAGGWTEALARIGHRHPLWVNPRVDVVHLLDDRSPTPRGHRADVLVLTTLGLPGRSDCLRSWTLDALGQLTTDVVVIDVRDVHRPAADGAAARPGTVWWPDVDGIGLARLLATGRLTPRVVVALDRDALAWWRTWSALHGRTSPPVLLVGEGVNAVEGGPTDDATWCIADSADAGVAIWSQGCSDVTVAGSGGEVREALERLRIARITTRSAPAN